MRILATRSLIKKREISSVNVTKFAGNCGFCHVYGRNPLWKPSFFVRKVINNQSNQSNYTEALLLPMNAVKTFTHSGKGFLFLEKHIFLEML